MWLGGTTHSVQMMHSPPPFPAPHPLAVTAPCMVAADTSPVMWCAELVVERAQTSASNMPCVCVHQELLCGSCYRPDTSNGGSGRQNSPAGTTCTPPRWLLKGVCMEGFMEPASSSNEPCLPSPQAHLVPAGPLALQCPQPVQCCCAA